MVTILFSFYLLIIEREGNIIIKRTSHPHLHLTTIDVQCVCDIILTKYTKKYRKFLERIIIFSLDYDLTLISEADN